MEKNDSFDIFDVQAHLVNIRVCVCMWVCHVFAKLLQSKKSKSDVTKTNKKTLPRGVIGFRLVKNILCKGASK